jgi:hypothetical protein
MKSLTEKSPQPSAFTPALEAVRGDLLKYIEASCYLVVSHDGYWGRGDTADKAALTCLNQGASRTALATVLLILGDETAEISQGGNIIRDAGSQKITVIERVRLGALILKKRKEKTE